MAHDQTKLFLEAFKEIEVALSGLNPDPIETIAQYRKRQLRSEMLNATAVVSSSVKVLGDFLGHRPFPLCHRSHKRGCGLSNDRRTRWHAKIYKKAA
jgi:hypothetical protein